MDQSKPKAIIRRTIVLEKTSEMDLTEEWVLLSGTIGVVVKVVSGIVYYARKVDPEPTDRGIKLAGDDLIELEGPVALRAMDTAAKIEIYDHRISIRLV